MAVMGASLPREFPGDHEMLMSPRKEQSSNENVAEVCPGCCCDAEMLGIALSAPRWHCAELARIEVHNL
jgi:hypothetical protein